MIGTLSIRPTYRWRLHQIPEWGAEYYLAQVSQEFVMFESFTASVAVVRGTSPFIEPPAVP